MSIQQPVPETLRLGAVILMKHAMDFAAENVHPDHRDGGEEERTAQTMEATQNAMTACLNAAIMEHGLLRPHGLAAVGALVGSLLVQAGDDYEEAMDTIIAQAANVMAQYREAQAQAGAH